MRIGAILPHLQMYGGNRRYLELGNCFARRGIDFTIYSKKGGKCDWFDFNGRIAGWDNIQADYILCGDPPSFGVLPKVKGKVFIYVQAGGGYIMGSRWAKGGYLSVYGRYPFIANHRAFLRYFPKAHLVEGGVNTSFFRPPKRPHLGDEIIILYYDSRRACKGSDYIRNELNDIPGTKLLGISNLRNRELLDAYQGGDFFVSWESREGWPNMAAEALACGLTVVTNGFNCQPFMRGVTVVKSLRQFFMDTDNHKRRGSFSMEQFSWERNAAELLNLFGQRHKEQHHDHKHQRRSKI